MAVLVFKDCFLSIGGTDFSDHVRQVTLDYNAEALDKTAMTYETRTRMGGLKDYSIDVDFFQDYAAGSIDATLFSLVGSSTIAIVIRPTTAAKAVGNPEYTATTFLENYQPVGGQVGEMAMAPVRFLPAGDLSRATS